MRVCYYLAVFFILSCKSLALDYTCAISAPSLVFGNIVPFDFTNTDVDVTISVTCTKTVPGSVQVDYTLSFSPGGSNDQLDREMTSSSDPTRKLKYNIYRNNARTRILGNDTQGTRTWSRSYNINSNQSSKRRTRRVKGRVPIQPGASVGSYADTILVQLEYNNQ